MYGEDNLPNQMNGEFRHILPGCCIHCRTHPQQSNYIKQRKIADYLIITGDYMTVPVQVQRFISKGFNLYGYLVCNGSYLFQAMVKYKD